MDGHITDSRNKRMKETSRRQGRMEASSKGGQGQEGAITTWEDDGLLIGHGRLRLHTVDLIPRNVLQINV
jgi:hypothetical protein